MLIIIIILKFHKENQDNLRLNLRNQIHLNPKGVMLMKHFGINNHFLNHQETIKQTKTTANRMNIDNLLNHRFTHLVEHIIIICIRAIKIKRSLLLKNLIKFLHNLILHIQIHNA